MPTFLSLPDKASSIAGSVNILLLTMLAVGFLFALGIILLAFGALTSADSETKAKQDADKNKALPLLWSVVVGVVILVFFLWSSFVYLNSIKVPDNAENVLTVAKHWVWKFQHTPDGKGEIDELHVVVGKPVRLIMTAQDTTHSLFAPNLLQQQAILPGRFTAMWFQIDKPGEYPFFTSEYDGTGYTKMTGKIIAMEQPDYDAWLGGKVPAKPEEGGGKPAGGLVAEGEALFASQGCGGCHGEQDTPVAPTLHGIYGSDITLADGGTVTVDDDYLHNSIINPPDQIVKGYNAIMPQTYKDDLSDEQIQALIDYIKSLSGVTPAAGGETGGGASTGGEAAAGAAMALSPEAMTIYTDNGCNACHGQQLEGMIGPNLAGLDADYVIHTVRNGVEGSAMAVYGPDKISEDDLSTLAQSINSLSFAATGMKVNPTVAQHLQEASAAFDAGDMAATKTALEATLAACGQMGGQATLKTMLEHLAAGDADYLKMRFDILMAGKSGGEGASSEMKPTPEPTRAPAPTKAPATEATAAPAVPADEGDATAGEAAFTKNGCNACHTDADTPVAPTLHGIFGKEIKLADGSAVMVDADYIHESIVDPHAKLAEGYGPVMPPTYAEMDSQMILDIIAYIKSLAQ